MANPLSELFGKIAKSIRNGLGDLGKLKPAAFPDKIDEIVGMISSRADEIDKYLDTINGEVVGEELFHVTFMSGDVEVVKVPVYEGYDCPDPINSGLIGTPAKESTKYIAYTYIGWSFTEGGNVDSKALLSIDGDRTVYAVFKEDYIYVAKGSWVHPEVSENYMNWNIDPDYTLSISGNLESIFAPNYAPYLNGEGYSTPPWWAFKDKILSVVVNCEQIGSGWFYSHSKLSNVLLDNTMTSIGMRAFSECSSLKTIKLPNALRQIANNTFDTSALTSITIPATTKYIRQGAFRHVPLTSAIFEKKDNWYYSASSSNVTTQGTLLEESQVEDISFMASLLTDTQNYTFENADEV